MAQPLPPNSDETLHQLLQERLDDAERIPEIDAQITAIFNQTHAILVLDSSGFSRLTAEAGIIQALTQIHQLRSHLPPVVAAYNGTILKFEADNAYVLFPDVDAAVQGAIALRESLRSLDIAVSMGIGYGDLLVVNSNDAYGAPFNEASKLGEDVAGIDEIWLTAAAMPHVTIPGLDVTPVTLALSGLNLTAYQLQIDTSDPDDRPAH